MTNEYRAEGATELLRRMVRHTPVMLLGMLLFMGVANAAKASQPQIRAIGAGTTVESRRPGELMRVPQRTVLIRSVNAQADQVMATNQPLRQPPPPQPTAEEMEALQRQELESRLASSFNGMAGSQIVAAAAQARQVSRPLATTNQPAVAGYRSHSYVPKQYKRLYSLSTYKTQIQYASRTHGVDEALVRAIIHAESSYNPKARSPVGAGGLMQLMPATATRFGVSNRFDPSQNIDGGTRYLAWLLERYRGNVTLAAAAYNAGEGAVDKYRGVPPYRETINYVAKVDSLFTQYRRAMTGIFDGSIASVSDRTPSYTPAYSATLRAISSR